MRIGFLISKLRLGIYGFWRILFFDSMIILVILLFLYYWKEIVVVFFLYIILYFLDFMFLGSNLKNDMVVVLYWILMIKNDWVWFFVCLGMILIWYSYIYIWYRNVYCRVMVGIYCSCIIRFNVFSYYNMIRV